MYFIEIDKFNVQTLGKSDWISDLVSSGTFLSVNIFSKWPKNKWLSKS